MNCRVTPFWLWLLQRGSGLLLGPLVALHVGIPELSGHALLNALLLLIVVGHAYSGLWRLAGAYGTSRARMRIAMAAATAFVIVGALFGIMIVLAMA